MKLQTLMLINTTRYAFTSRRILLTWTYSKPGKSIWVKSDKQAHSKMQAHTEKASTNTFQPALAYVWKLTEKLTNRWQNGGACFEQNMLPIQWMNESCFVCTGLHLTNISYVPAFSHTLLLWLIFEAQLQNSINTKTAFLLPPNFSFALVQREKRCIRRQIEDSTCAFGFWMSTTWKNSAASPLASGTSVNFMSDAQIWAISRDNLPVVYVYTVFHFHSFVYLTGAHAIGFATVWFSTCETRILVGKMKRTPCKSSQSAFNTSAHISWTVISPSNLWKHRFEW